MSDEASLNLAREAVKSLRGFIDLASLQGKDGDHAAALFLQAAGAAAGLAVGRKKAAAALRMVATELVEADTVDELRDPDDPDHRRPD